MRRVRAGAGSYHAGRWSPVGRQRRRVGRFGSPAPLAVSQLRDDPTTWETTAPLIFRSATGRIVTVPVGSRTDWASRPRLLASLIDKMLGSAAAAPVVHDYCYRVLCLTGEMTYQEADALLEEMLTALDREATRWRDRTPAPTRWLVWDAVRLASIATRRGGAWGARRDLPRLLAITPPGLLLVVPAGLVVLPFMGLFIAANYLATRLEPKETTP